MKAWTTSRSRAEQLGIAFEVAYTGESFSALRGEGGRSPQYRGSVDLILALDFERLGLWRGAALVVSAQNVHGRGIGERLGDLQTVSNIDADPFTQLSEYWLEQRFFDGRIRLKLGKQDANADFCASDFGADFLNSSFGLIPTIPMPTFPAPGLGVALFAELVGELALGVGIYDGAAEGGQSEFRTTFDREGGAFSVTEVALRHALGRNGSLPGLHRLGFWYHSGEVEELSGAPGRGSHARNYGVYAYFDQLLYAEPASEGEEGLGLFGQFGWAPDDRNEITHYVGGGFSYRGPIPRRSEDVIGVGVAHARLSGELSGEGSGGAETAIELFYRVQLAPRLSLQPDLQLVLHPAGAGGTALAAGLRFEVGF